VLSAGSWYKFSVTADGVYKIDYSLLQKAGVNLSQLDPRNIKVFTGQPGMLPQPNSTPRVNDLTEISILVSGEADGKLDGSDYILFFAQGPDVFNYDAKSNFFNYQNNLYSDKNFYFLTIGTSPGKRISTVPSANGNFPEITQFDDFAYYEKDQYNLLHSGRQWFGEQFDQSQQLTIQFDFPGIVPQSTIKFTSHVMAQSITDCSFDVFYNSQSIKHQVIPSIQNSTYATKGNIVADTVSFNESSVNASTQSAQQIKYQFNKGSPGISIGYLDYLIFSVQRSLALYGNQTIFTSVASKANPASTFKISTSTSSAAVWNITQPFQSKIQASNSDGSNITFNATTDTLKKFVVFDPAKVSSPTFESTVANQNLHAITSADLLIISYPALLSQANRLAAFRQSHDQLNASVVTTDQVFNEFGGGKPDLTSIRDFVRNVYKQSNGQLKYVLVFGRGSYDYKNRTIANTNLVPIYESYNSLDPLGTYSSDDYFGFLEDSEGAWSENPPASHTLDVGVGRIPAKDVNEAKQVVDKLIEYATDPNRLGEWCKEFLFVADDGDFNIHQSQADQLANSVEQNHPEFNTKKLFLDYYKQTMKPNGQVSPDASKSLDLSVRKGLALVNYTGHGSEQVWTQELILTPELVQSWKNGPMYPLFVTATCEFGRNDDPSIISSAELALLQKEGGAIGLVTTARPVNSSTNFQLNQAFYQSLFTKENNAFRRLGSVMRDTKNNSLSGISNRNFSLLGDPSMKLILPVNQIVVNEIKTLSGTDSLKALSTVTVKGEVQASGSKLTGFNGKLNAVLFDQVQTFVTRGDPDEVINAPSPPYTFVQRSNELFQGGASVTQGAFQIDFVIANDLVPGFGSGKLSLYTNANDGTSAGGASTNFIVGGLEPSPPIDTKAPLIQLFINDSTFVNGGTVGPNTKLVAYLSDESGINSATYNSQNEMIATLDNKWSYVVNDYYKSEINNYQRGVVSYPLDTLKKGAHQLSLSASDTHNNRTTTTVNFVVTDGSTISVNDFVNYPNPFNNSGEGTTFHFSHTRAGEDLEATLVIYDMTGQPLATLDYSIPSSAYQVDLEAWDGKTPGGTKFGPGIYVARLSVRSLADGSQNAKATKLIILN
jgi:hypothetical protein